jgi:membrane protein YdbS with pleckstrin-like domain
MFGLVVASIVLAVLLRVVNGHGADIYYGGRGLPIPNIAALVTIVAVALVLVIWLVQLAWRKWRHLIVRDSDA